MKPISRVIVLKHNAYSESEKGVFVFFHLSVLTSTIRKQGSVQLSEKSKSNPIQIHQKEKEKNEKEGVLFLAKCFTAKFLGQETGQFQSPFLPSI